MAAKKSRANRPGGNLINRNQRKQLEAMGYGLPTKPKPAKKKAAAKKGVPRKRPVPLPRFPKKKMSKRKKY